ncbi:hypothetical protein HanXRQr2_Chr04g0173441 [Helianthus annuus]|uniref:Uncharacterized protein n=1 Tax=Helianthus annuus TaxID=4232 RepID=A0A9K3J8K1_HELAN|nr:hypothetical protein HanXRQr2_Chr04g0173441 [Helianthus annuus]
MNSLNIFCRFFNLHVFQGIRDLARGCDFYLDESQVLNGVYFMFVVVSYEQDFILLCCIFVACVDI